MKKFNLTLLYLSLLVLSVIILNGCKKDKTVPDNPTNGKSMAVFNPSITYGTMRDQDGNTYKTVVIGTQTWMAENLRTVRYRSGDSVSFVPKSSNWAYTHFDAYCNYNNTTDLDSIATFGRLYNWYAVTSNLNLAPSGWHIPTEAEWSVLANYLGGDTVAGIKMKETGTTHWIQSSNSVTNESGFTALPAGLRFNDGSFGDINYQDRFWSFTGFPTQGIYHEVSYEVNGLLIDYADKTYGFSVRCVKD
jgi:uncharacterized protein (TIGR02145 family)